MTPAGDQIWTQQAPGVASLQTLGVAEGSDFFGSALATGDFNGDGSDDLAVGVLGEGVGNREDAGALNVILGVPGVGLTTVGSQIWTQRAPGVASRQTLGRAETGDSFGGALAAGDFNGDGRDDLAVGVPGEGVGNRDGAGAVNVILGVPGMGLTVAHQIWTQGAQGFDSLQTQGVAEESDFFGRALVTGDFNGDGRDDLAVGVPGEGVGNREDAGALNITYSTPADATGLTPDGNEIWTQGAPSVESLQTPGAAEAGDGFAMTLTTGDFDGNGLDDLAVGVPREDVGDLENAGAFNIIYAFGGPGNQIWTQGAPGVDSLQTEGIAEEDDVFGIISHAYFLGP